MKESKGDKRPYLKPVTRIELSEKNIGLRVILLAVLLAVAAAALFTGVRELLKVEPGWQKVEIASRKPHCGGDFVLMYDFSDYGGSAAAANRELTALYTTAAENAYVVFSPDTEDPAVQNLWLVNRHVNEPIAVDPVLYRAFEQIQTAGNRSIYLAPVYAEYNRVFLCENEAEATLYDPSFNGERISYLQELAAFASDPQAINIVLLGDNQVKLTVSEAYLTFAEEYELETLVDFAWLKNAFIADYLAQVLIENGYTCGYLSSFDGFTRNLDNRDNSYSFNFFDRQGNDVNLPAKMTYSGPQSIVFLRDYPMCDQDRWHYFAYSSGHITSIHIDPSDGRCKASVDSLVGYARDKGCAEILLNLIPVFVADTFTQDALLKLAGNDIFTVWFEDSQLCTTDPAFPLEWLDESYSLK